MKYQDFYFCYKIISSSRAVKVLFLSFTCEDIGVAMVTNMTSQLHESFLLRRAPVLLKFHSQNGFEVRRRYSYRWLSPNFQIDTFPSLKNIQEVSESDVKKFYLCRNFISIYKTNRTLRSQAVVPSKKEGGGGKLRFNSLIAWGCVDG